MKLATMETRPYRITEDDRAAGDFSTRCARPGCSLPAWWLAEHYCRTEAGPIIVTLALCGPHHVKAVRRDRLVQREVDAAS